MHCSPPEVMPPPIHRCFRLSPITATAQRYAMRTRLLLMLLALGFPLAAKDLAILGKSEVIELGRTPAGAPADPAKAAFLCEFEHIATPHTALEGELTLGNPPAWGKSVAADTSGHLEFERASAGGFVGRLTLEKLHPKHRYILTLNGNPKLAGNDLLPDPVPGLPEEKFYDFLTIETDAAGRYEATLGIFLKPGAYAVRLYVKDTDDFKIVLYHDYFPFTVK